MVLEVFYAFRSIAQEEKMANNGSNPLILIWI